MKLTNQEVLLLVIQVFSIFCSVNCASLQVVRKTNDKYTSNDEAKHGHEVSKDEGEIEKLEDNMADNEEEELPDDLEGKDDPHEENDSEEKESQDNKALITPQESHEEDEPQHKEKSDDNFDDNELDKGIADAKEANEDLQKQIDLLNQRLQDFINKKQGSSNSNDAAKSVQPEGKGTTPGAKLKSESKDDSRSKDESDFQDDISNEDIKDEDDTVETGQNQEAKDTAKKDKRKVDVKGDNGEEKKDAQKEDLTKQKEDDKKEDVTVLGPGGENKDLRDETGEDEDSLPDDDY